MYTKLIIDGDAVYETDEECLAQKKNETEEEKKQQSGKQPR